MTRSGRRAGAAGSKATEAEAGGRSNSTGQASNAAGRASAGSANSEGSTGSAGPGAWLELAVRADNEAVEAISEILGRVAPGGTSVEPAFELIEEGLAARPDLSAPVTVRAYLPARDGAAAEAAVAEVDEALGHLRAFDLRPIGELETRVVHEADWADAWKAHFPVLRIGERIVIRPTWRRHRRVPGDVVIAMDPGMAFGTGLHPTTRLCLQALEDAAARGVLGRGGAADGAARVLDVGCGSGVLAIAALKLGAAEAFGVDTDPIAIEATDANARRNGVARRLASRVGPLPSGRPAFDVVLANLIASLLVRIAGELRDEVRVGGTLIASGIFIDREPEVRAAIAAVGLDVTRRLGEGDWVALEAVRRA